MSNSKLTRAQKDFRKFYMAKLVSAGGTIATVGRFTVAIVPEFPGSNMARMSVAFASEDEQKIRRKVGEYHALYRWKDNQSVPVPVNFEARDMADFMEESYEF